ncbi:MAG: NusG domain II-containing protein [bacterium LCO1.1]|uniref:NusG domain II-containing protein n=1 Tax=Candidatus Weimeria bifida TaxID=2599074 RepID=A0A6N7IW68_9FIRM|nr:NusG domain II-containing protein [Candidatus Weimeria bifida]
MKTNPYISKKSIIIICIVLAVLAIFSVCFYSSRNSGDVAVITCDGKRVGSFPLNRDRLIPIKNSRGTVTNTVQIKNGEVFMKYADCPDQICVKMGHKSKDGESITCLPNKVFVEVKSHVKSDIDVTTN